MANPERRTPRWPITAALAAHRAGLETAAERLRTTARLPERVSDMAAVEVGSTPSEVVYRENKLELHRYESQTEAQHDVPILVVYALINRPFILDLQPDRSVVRRLLEAGHDVYLIDWHEPSRLDTSLGLGDYVNRYIDNCVDVVRERSGQDAINVLGYCMGGTLSTIYAALHPEKVAALALMATGLYFEDTGGVLETWGDESAYDPRAVVDTLGNVPGEFLAVGFAQMDPVTNYGGKYLSLFDRLENEDFVENFARMETWLAESVDLAGEAYAEFLAEIYQGNTLSRNELVIDGEHVDVSAIDMPFLQIVGEYDNLVPPAASLPFNDLVGSADVTTIQYPTGHVGLAVSRATHRDVWPEVAEWFLEQSGAASLADLIADGVESALGVDVETDVTAGNVDRVELRVADSDRTLAAGVVERTPAAIEAFLEEHLDVAIGVERRGDTVAVSVDTADGQRTTIVRDVGAAIKSEIEEAVQELDVAGTYSLEDVEGIGPTYASRLRGAGIDSVSELAIAEPRQVARAADASRSLAERWIDRAQALAGVEDETE